MAITLQLDKKRTIQALDYAINSLKRQEAKSTHDEMKKIITEEIRIYAHAANTIEEKK